MNNEDIRKKLLENPVSLLDDENKTELINKISEVFKKTIVEKVEDIISESEKNTKIPTLKKYDDELKSALMENEVNYLRSSSTPMYNANHNVNNLIYEITEKVIDKLAVKHFVGIQPLTGPVGLSYFLKYTNTSSSQEVSPSMEIVSQAIEAYSKKFKASLSIESMFDMEILHGNDIKSELIETISSNIAEELYSEIITDVKNIAINCEIDTIDEKDFAVKFMLLINKEATAIADASLRGIGNVLIVSKDIAKIFSSKLGTVFTESEENIEDFGFTKKIGTYFEKSNVYVDYSMEDSTILMGYRGSNDTDVGYIYSPYIMLMSTGVVINPETFQPTIRFMTRYGKYITNLDVDDKSSYYRLLKFKNIPDIDDIAPLKETKEQQTSEDMRDLKLDEILKDVC